MKLSYCPVCGGRLAESELSGRVRQHCADAECGYVFWDNPVPVVAAIVEHRGKLVLARNVKWPQKMFGLVTGFLESGESPEEGVLREVKEELDLDGEAAQLVGLYPFPRMNQLLLAFHVRAAPGEIRLNEELAEYRELDPGEVRYWPGGTGLAVKDFLEARGYQPDEVELPPQLRAYLAGS